MESLPGHNWRENMFSGEHHQVADPVTPDADGVVWAACRSGSVTALWAEKANPGGEKRCFSCLVMVGSRATARRARRIADTGSQTPAAFLALNTAGPVVRATATRLHGLELEP
jgi:hypothetical protein